MIRFFAAFLSLICATTFVVAQDFRLVSPIDCRLDGECYIMQFVDHDPGEEYSDFRCKTMSYNGHKGTDFALRTTRQMLSGVNVLASASGVVKGVRNTMDDVLFSEQNKENIKGRECGNGVVLEHEDGWETQYCHLKKGSVTVASGQFVEAGTILGQVGLSGLTEFPHVHLSVRKDGEMVDPFDPDGEINCEKPDAETLWETPLYSPSGGIVYGGFTDHLPAFEAVKSGHIQRHELSAKAPALVVFVLGYGVQKGDQFHFEMKGPNDLAIDKTVELNKNQAFSYRGIGQKLKTGRWPAGQYSGRLSLIRAGKVIDTEMIQTIVK